MLKVENNGSLYSEIHAKIISSKKEGLSTAIEEINRDIPRTYIINKITEVTENELFNILVAIAYVEPGIGY